MNASDALELMDWKRRVAATYAAVREADGTPDAVAAFRAARDELFTTHPQSPVPPDRRAAGVRPAYFPHHPALRVAAPLLPDPDGAVLVIAASTGEATRFRRIGWVHPVVGGREVRLAVYWLEGYGGGLFLPFRDATAGDTTYGGGRYLLDTVKGADHGVDRADRLVLDFNLAYHPSCAHDPRWSCPLPPPENAMDIPIPAGERTPG